MLELCNDTNEGSIIIYCGSRKKAEEHSNFLLDNKLKVEYYHAGLDDDVRKKVQENFISDKNKIILATNAFGMGIDKPDVRKVIHLDFTQTIEAYYQEAGRAGRDGKPSDCIMLYNYSDRRLQEFFIKNTFPEKKEIKKLYNFLYDMSSAALGELPTSPNRQSDVHLANLANMPDKRVSSIINFFERNSILRRNAPSQKPLLFFIVTKKSFYPITSSSHVELDVF